MGPSLTIIALAILMSSCHCYKISGVMNDEYQDTTFEMEKTLECYLRVAIKRCLKGAELDVFYKIDDEGKKIMVDGKKDHACVPVKCTTSDKLALSTTKSASRALGTTVYIRGPDMIVTPDILPEGYKMRGVYESEVQCNRPGSSSASIIVCKEKKKSEDLIKSEEFDEMFSDEQENNADSDSLPFEYSHKPVAKDDAMYDTQDDGNDHQTQDKDRASIEDHVYMSAQDPPEYMSMQNDYINEEMDEHDKALAELQEEIVGDHEIAKVQWNNWFRGTISVNCPNRQAVYWVKSQHSNHYEDRIWSFTCKHVTNLNYNHCYWTGYQNSYDYPLFVHCGSNYVMTGLYSRYSVRHRDRRFNVKCCRAPYYYTKTCSMTGFVNGWDGNMNYAVGGSRVFTGLYSYHDNGKEDRIWKISSCYYVR